MRRPITFALAIFLLVTMWLATPAAAASDDDVPGTALTIGGTVSGAVSSGDKNDVYAVTLAAGQEVHITCDPGTTGGGAGSFHLLVPGASSINDPGDFDEMIYNLSGGSFIRWWADYDYIPAKSGTYFLWVEWEKGDLSYTLSVKGTSRAALVLAPESDDIPGVPLGAGIVTGVVSTLADHDDVYSVQLTAGQPVTIRLAPLTPFNNSYAYAYLTLLDPNTPSVSRYSSHRIGDRVKAENSDEAAERVTAEIRYTPTQSATYYIWVEAGGVLYGYNFGYHLSVVGGADGGGTTFPDVPAGHPYEAAVNELCRRSIIGGYQSGLFGLDDPVKRAQFAKMIVGTLDITPNTSTATRFTDLGSPDANGYPHVYVQTAYDHGVTYGTNTAQTLFAPWNYIRRDQVVSMIVRGARSERPGILVDPPPGTTSQFAAVPEPHGTNLRIAEYNHLLDGLTGMGPGWSVTTDATRGEVAQMLYNLLLKLQ